MSDRMQYNGMPMFMVDFDDFSYVLECIDGNKRLLSRNIRNPDLKDYFTASRKPKFAVSYSEIVVSYGK